MHVMGDSLKRQLAPLQQRSREAWLYIGPNDYNRIMWGEVFDLTQQELEILVQGMTGDGFVPEQLILPPSITPPLRGPAAEDGGAEQSADLGRRRPGRDPDRRRSPPWAPDFLRVVGGAPAWRRTPCDPRQG